MQSLGAIPLGRSHYLSAKKKIILYNKNGSICPYRLQDSHASTHHPHHLSMIALGMLAVFDVLCRSAGAGERVSDRDNGAVLETVKGGERKAKRGGTGWDE